MDIRCSEWKLPSWWKVAECRTAQNGPSFVFDSPTCTVIHAFCTLWVKSKERVKSFLSLMAHWEALISVPLALSQTPAYTAKTADTGPVHHAVCPSIPRRLGRYQIILLGNRGTWVWTTCPELLPGSGHSRGSNSRPLNHESDTLTPMLPGHPRPIMYHCHTHKYHHMHHRYCKMRHARILINENKQYITNTTPQHCYNN